METQQLTTVERFPVNGGGDQLEYVCGVLADAVHTLATRRALRGISTRGYFIFWRSSPGQCGYLSFTTTDEPIPDNAEYAVPGDWIDAGYKTRDALRAKFRADAQRLPILDPNA